MIEAQVQTAVEQVPVVAPQAQPAELVQPAVWKRREVLALKLLAGGAATFALLLFVRTLMPGAHGPWVSWIGMVGAWLTWAGVIASVLALRFVVVEKPRMRWLLAPAVLLQVVGGALFALLSLVASRIVLDPFTRGRQLRRFGKILLPPVTAGDAWTSLPLRVDLDPDLRSALAEQWRQNGRTEHASIAAFAKLTLDLVALGAPPKLIADSQRDALDELRHTELCFSLARALDGKAESPGPFPEARSGGGAPDFERLAVDSLIDGALHEGVSARVIARLVKRCEEPATREVLRELAADEGRHAAHGWDVVEWCLAEGGPRVHDALVAALAKLPTEINSSLPAAARGGAWERFGIHGAALETDEYARMRENLIRRVAALSPRALAA